MYVSIFMILFNLFLLCLFKSIKSGTNDYNKEKNRYYKLRIKYMLRYINIGYILIYLFHFLIITCSIGISCIDHLSISLGLYILNALLYIILENIMKIKSTKFKLIDKKILDSKSILLIISFYILFIIEKVGYIYNYKEESIIGDYDFINNYNIILKILSVIVITASLFYIINLLIKNKEYCAYSYDKDSYLQDIKFYSKLDIKKSFNYIIYLLAYVIFFYINIPFIYFFYIALILLLIYLIKRKIKKISNESDRLYKSVTLANQKPGIIYSFQFTRDILLLKKMIVFTIMLVFSTIIYYGLGESIFSYTVISLYICLLYIIISDKLYLIRYLSSLNDKFIDEKKYSILENKNINYIDTIKIFNIKLFKLIIVDTIIYESNMILYDPEYRIDNIDIRINKSNINDYITLETELYEE